MKFSKDLFAANLRSARAYRGVSQSELAKEVGVSQEIISLYERGEKVPGADKVVALCEALSKTPNELMGWTS